MEINKSSSNMKRRSKLKKLTIWTLFNYFISLTYYLINDLLIFLDFKVTSLEWFILFVFIISGIFYLTGALVMLFVGVSNIYQIKTHGNKVAISDIFYLATPLFILGAYLLTRIF
jgi:hypothetical protein